MAIQFFVEPLPKRVSDRALEAFLNKIVAEADGPLATAVKRGGQIVGTTITNAVIADGSGEDIIPVMVFTLLFPEPEEGSQDS